MPLGFVESASGHLGWLDAEVSLKTKLTVNTPNSKKLLF